jgi:hypothetical protein
VASRAPSGPPRQSPALTPGQRRRRRRLALHMGQSGNQRGQRIAATATTERLIDVAHPVDFLYSFKAARRAARAADLARSPPLPLALPLRRRKRRSGWREKRNPGPPLTYISHQGSNRERCACSRCPDCPGRARTCQQRLRRRLRRSSTLDRTCPKVPESAAIESRGKSGQDMKGQPSRAG